MPQTKSIESEATARTTNVAQSANPVVPAKGIEQAFRCLYFLAKQGIPHTTNFVPLLDLAGLLGVDIRRQISIARNALYTSDKMIQEMLYVLSEVIEMSILADLKKSDHFSLMIDETTDCSQSEQLAIHCRFLDASTGKLRCHFLKIVDALEPEIEAVSEAEGDRQACVRLGAETITNRVREFSQKADLDLNKVRGIGTDGAATMVECRNGVVKRLKVHCPSAIGVHCAAHRLNLASSHAGNSVPFVKQFHTIIRQVYDFFNNSAVRTAGLKSIETLLEEKKKLAAPCQTRWLSIEKCVSVLKSSFTSVVVSLERESEERHDAKVLGLATLLCEYRFVATLLFLCDVLPHVTILSRCFQQSYCDYSIIPQMISTTLTALREFQESEGPNLRKLPEFLEHLKKNDINIKIKLNQGRDYFDSSIRKSYLDALILNIERRFEDEDVDNLTQSSGISFISPKNLQLKFFAVLRKLDLCFSSPISQISWYFKLRSNSNFKKCVSFSF